MNCDPRGLMLFLLIIIYHYHIGYFSSGSSNIKYINNGSDVYICLRDASKAFDRVDYGKLCKILLSKKLRILIIRLILDNYIQQSV